jgi:hypothetical protein
MQQLNFGRIEELVIQAGEPVFSPSVRLIQEIKIGGPDNGPRRELEQEDFLLRASVIELFSHFDRLGDATIGVVEVRHGLPFKVIVARSCGS